MKEKPTYKFAIREDLKKCGSLFLPQKAEPEATGWDVKAAFENYQSVSVMPGSYIKIPLGFRAFCPEGWWLELKPRSSTFAKKNLHCLYGTIDSTFEGQLMFAAQYIPDANVMPQHPLLINFGEPIGQIIPVKRKEMIVEEISNEEYDRLCDIRGGVRKDGGFGSTG